MSGPIRPVTPGCNARPVVLELSGELDITAAAPLIAALSAAVSREPVIEVDLDPRQRLSRARVQVSCDSGSLFLDFGNKGVAPDRPAPSLRFFVDSGLYPRQPGVFSAGPRQHVSPRGVLRPGVSGQGL